jgi:predicted phosphodiesterase
MQSKVGVIADTHGLLRPEAIDFLKRCDLIVHAGDIDDLDLDPAAAKFDAVIFGHSHQPVSYNKDGVLYFNPGSAGQRRFKLPVSIGRITIMNSRLESEIVTLTKKAI